MKTEKIKAYKALDMNFKCRDFQYGVGKTYHHKGEVSLCHSGFHACTNPLDVLDYYDLTACRFAEVELWGCTEEERDDSKRVGRHIKIMRELTLPEFIDVVNAELAASGNNSKLAASGNNSKLAASGYRSQLAASGNNSQLAASGNYSKLETSGENSVVANIGINGIVKGIKGTWITLAEYASKKCVCVKSAMIDGEKLKANTWYQLQNGEFTEVEQ